MTDAYDNAKVGDPKIDPDWPHRGMCAAEWDDWLCTRHPDHTGQHVAEAGSDVRAVWPNEWTRVDAYWCTVHSQQPGHYSDLNACDGHDDDGRDCRLVPCYIRTEENQP